MNNQVIENSWWSIYQTSGISVLDNVDVDTATGYKVYILNNFVYGNQEKYSNATDGEGIIVDTNMNSNAPGPPTIKNGSGLVITPPAYNGKTLVANNVLWGNGSSAIEAFHSRNVDIYSNSTYHDLVAPGFGGRGEIFTNNNSNINIVNNVLQSVSTSQPVEGVAYSGSSYSGYVDSGNNVFYLEGATLSYPSFINSFGSNYVDDPHYANPTPGSSWYNIDLTPLQNTDAATDGCVNGGVICSTPASDVHGTTRLLVAGHYPAGAYAGTHN